MYSQNILKWIVLGSALVADFASAAPAEVPCDDISKYTTEFFEDTKNMIWVPEHSTCLFYTWGFTASAARVSQSSALATIWDLFRCDLYADRSRAERLDPNDKSGIKTLPPDPTYPLRCIFAPVKENGVIAIDPNTKKPKQSEDELTYFSNMSRAMARHCDEYASLMTEKTKDPSKIPMAGIWGTVEFPELKLDKNDGGKVDLIDYFDSSMNRQGEFWCRDSGSMLCEADKLVGKTLAATNGTTISARAKSGHASCADPAKLEADDYTFW